MGWYLCARLVVGCPTWSCCTLWLSGSCQLLLLWHEGHVKETWTPQSVMRRLGRVFGSLRLGREGGCCLRLGPGGGCCVRPPVSLILFCCSDGQGSSYVWDLLGVGAFCLDFCCWQAGLFRCWGSGRSSPHLAPGAHAVGSGPGMSGLFSFCTDSSCRRRRVTRRQGRGGGVRRDDCCCDVPRAVAFRRPWNFPSGARELWDGS